MAGMEIDSPSSPERNSPMSPRDLIVQRLAQHGIPHEVLEQSQIGVVSFVKERNLEILGIVSSILPTDDDVSALRMPYKAEHVMYSSSVSIEDLFDESMLWLRWLMFECEPSASLKTLAQSTSGQRAVCGAVWGQNDLAYRCRTCEHDPTCAICVPCFLNGNHKDHDYSIMYTGGGCCDCGDVTAWKREGFCSQHRGIEQIEPLPEELANSVGPVLDALLVLWKDALVSVTHSTNAGQVYHTKIEKLTSSVVNMLLEFCRSSESLLSFISRRMFQCVHLLDVLFRAERFFENMVVKKLHELLLKLLGEPLFKYEFAKVFIRYYPVVVNEIIKNESSGGRILEKYPLLSTFSVQIFTVPTLTPRLVHEVNLLGVLFGCLMDLFRSCVGEDGHFQASNWTRHSEFTIRVVEDIRYVLSHDEVPKYIAYERPDISITWLELLTLVQGMDAQKRITGSPMEEENENISAPFLLGLFLGNVNDLFVQGALSVIVSKETKVASFCYLDSQDLNGSEDQRHSKVGRTSQGSSVCSISSRSSELDCVSHFSNVMSDAMTYLCVPSPVIWLTTECLKAIDGWLFSESALGSNFFSFDAAKSTHNMLSFRKKILKIIKGTQDNKMHKTSKMHRMEGQLPMSMQYERLDPVGSDMHHEYTSPPDMSVDSPMEVEAGLDSEVFAVLNAVDWPDIFYDVSSQEISFHIPLHRLLSLLLRTAMKTCCEEIEKMEKANKVSSLPLSSHGHDFFGKLLGRLHPYGFSAFLMEHPLRLRVFCAQVHAGMWRRNGDGAILSSEFYRSVQWYKQGIESDLFLLQCCAALAPAELFVVRIQERFGLTNYTSLNLLEHNEYEAVLVREMLTLIIQIVVERRFSGLSTSDSLKRELIYWLAIGDATHSQLVKSLPRDLSKNDELQNIVDMVAVYSDPSSMKQGKYSLRKAYWKELDLYHPRWSSKDLQVAEERYFRFCKTSALNIQLPRWSDVYGPLKSISSIATSMAVSKIIRAVFYYATLSEVSSVSRVPDGLLITALHILSLALDICGSQDLNNTSHHDPRISSSHSDHSCMEPQSHAKDSAPILTCATEEFSTPAHDGSDLCAKQSMLSLLVILMKKHKEDNDNDAYCTEPRHCNISSLIENLLKKFAELNTECLSTLQHLAPEVVFDMLRQPLNLSAHSSASTSDFRERKAKAREHQAAMMAKMRAEQSKFIANLNSTPENEEDTISKEKESNKDHGPEDSAPVCSLCRDPHSQSSLCFLVLLQKSRLTSFVERGPISWENDHPPNDELPSSRIEVSNNLSDVDANNPMQSVHNEGELSFNVDPAEVNAFLDRLKEHLPNIKNIELLNASMDTKADTSLPLETIEDDIYHSVRDLHDTNYSSAHIGEQKHLASHVEAEPKRFLNTDSSVLGEYIACLSRESKQNHSSSIRRIGTLTSRSAMSNTLFGVFGPSDCDGIHITSCGHAVHQECHERYLLSLKQRYIRRLGFEGVHIVDPDLGELLCPVCRRFANSILPAYPGISSKVGKRTPFMSIRTPSSCGTDVKTLRFSTALFLIQSTGEIVGQGKFLKAFSGKLSESTNPALEPCLQKLYMMHYPQSYNTLSSPGRLSKSLVLWDMLRYSVISTEIAARGRMNVCTNSLKSFLESLYGELDSSSGFILSILLHNAQSARSSSRLEVLLRLRGLQLLAGSICSGVSCHNLSNSDKRKGVLSSLTEKTEDGEVFPDIQFWELLTTPVLAQDPFSSLLWVLFCLPHRFVSSNEAFVALVHLFYVACVVQAMITCYNNQGFDVSSFGVCLLGDVCKTMSESKLVRQCFVSNDVDFSCHPKDMIRRLTFPYLRRCALLWKLLNYSIVAPLYDSSHAPEGSCLSVRDDEIESSDCLRTELSGIQELENMFGLCSLDIILKDETVHALSVRWCNHFFEEFRVRKCGNILSSAPAVPFKLMKLPRLYQDLLQRYVKQECSFCKLVPVEPALCLLCGQLCSANWKPCCRRSKCLIHAMACGAGIGVFLLVRKTTIMLQRCTRQAFWPSPYLDAFGEEDHDVRRGKALYLSEERYTALTYMIASHGLDRSSQVLRQTTISFTGFD